MNGINATDAAGDTAATLREAGIDTIAPLDDTEAIRAKVEEFLGLLASGAAPLPDEVVVKQASRNHAAKVLADVFNRL